MIPVKEANKSPNVNMTRRVSQLVYRLSPLASHTVHVSRFTF
jgi:hypothetical protein